jgi:hypothetical protein
MKLSTVWKLTLQCMAILLLLVAGIAASQPEGLNLLRTDIWIIVSPLVLPFVYNCAVVLSEIVRLFATEPKIPVDGTRVIPYKVNDKVVANFIVSPPPNIKGTR